MKTNSLLLKALILFSGIALGAFLTEYVFEENEFLSGTQEVREGTYKLINPLLECNSSENSFVELKTFKNELSDYADNMNKGSDNVDFISVYFRDLNNGPWFGINQSTDFNPASLLKLPIAIIYFKEAERDPSILDRTYVFENDGALPSDVQTIKPSNVVEFGKSYSVKELIRRMLVYSDNYAQHLLVKNIDVDTLKKVYSDFFMSVPTKDNPNTMISVIDYARFFRVLFNASYLDQGYSEDILEYLSQSEYKDGIVAGVSAGITVAHKFGERQNGDSTKQLHDCGIVYYPNHPYLLCVMTRGKNNKDLGNAIKNVSNFVYKEIDSQYGGK